MTGLFAATSPALHQRVEQARQDMQLTRQGDFRSSLGYRLALWDVGIQGITERPFFGHGVGMAARYFERTIPTYKNGIYENLLELHNPLNYHNDWIEIGMQLGALGLMAYAFLLRSWFQTFKIHRLEILGGALICFVILSGLTDNLVFFDRLSIFFLLQLPSQLLQQTKRSLYRHRSASQTPFYVDLPPFTPDFE